jgi:predicted Fe-Mo cluster-binding NifX family protein
MEKKMKIAIPTADGKLAMHFGHCDVFAVFTVDEKEKTVLSREYLTPPPHEPGVLPAWLHEQGVNLIIAGGMGSRAQQLFVQNNIQVVVGASGASPEELVKAWMDGTLVSGANACDH